MISLRFFGLKCQLRQPVQPDIRIPPGVVAPEDGRCPRGWRPRYPRGCSCVTPEDVLPRGCSLPQRMFGVTPEDVRSRCPRGCCLALPQRMLRRYPRGCSALPQRMFSALPQRMASCVTPEDASALPQRMLSALPQRMLSGVAPEDRAGLSVAPEDRLCLLRISAVGEENRPYSEYELRRLLGLAGNRRRSARVRHRKRCQDIQFPVPPARTPAPENSAEY